MDTILSARVDEAVVERIGGLARQLRASKKAGGTHLLSEQEALSRAGTDCEARVVGALPPAGMPRLSIRTTGRLGRSAYPEEIRATGAEDAGENFSRTAT